MKYRAFLPGRCVALHPAPQLPGNVCPMAIGDSVQLEGGGGGGGLLEVTVKVLELKVQHGGVELAVNRTVAPENPAVVSKLAVNRFVGPAGQWPCESTHAMRKRTAPRATTTRTMLATNTLSSAVGTANRFRPAYAL